MKRFLNILLIISLTLTAVAALSSCAALGGTTTCVSHTDMNSDGLCDMCSAEYTCPGHRDANSDGYCDFCFASFICEDHYDADADLKCDECGVNYVCPGHTDVNGDSKCDTCLAPFKCNKHADANVDGKCDVCAAEFVCPVHVDKNSDKKCDTCLALWSCPGHKDTDENSECDVCGAAWSCPGHADSGVDGYCDNCFAIWSCPGHKDENPEDGKCDICLASYSKPVDYRDAFKAAADATDPSKLTVTVKSVDADLGELTSVYVIDFAEDGSFTITATVQSFNEDVEGDLILTKTVVITCDAAGNYSDNGEFVGANPVATGLSINFAALKSFVTPTANVLNATVASADSAAVFGIALGADANLVVNKSATAITGVSVTYANVNINCMYE